jgi:hypothetical protein
VIVHDPQHGRLKVALPARHEELDVLLERWRSRLAAAGRSSPLAASGLKRPDPNC